MKKLLLAVTIIALIAGCSHEIPNPINNIDVPEAPPAPQNLHASVGDRSITLEWTISDTTGIVSYRIYTADSLAGPYNLLDSSTASAYTAENLHNGFVYFYRVSAVNSTTIEGPQSAAVFGTPNLFAVIINDGAEECGSRTVNLTMVAPTGTALMRISNSPDFAQAPWEPFAAVRSWILTSGNGTKNVYAMFRDGEGNVTGDTLSDSIELLIQPYFYSLEINSGADRTFSRNVELDITAPQGTSFMMIANDSTFADAYWQAFQATRQWHIQPDVAANGDTVRFYALFKDQNDDSVEVRVDDDIVLACADPVTINPVYQPLDQYQSIALSWSNSLSSDFYAYRIYRSLGGSSADTLITTYRDVSQTDYTDNLNLTDLSSDTLVSVYYMVRFVSIYDDSSDSAPVEVRLVNRQPPQLSLFVSSINYDTDTTTGLTNLQASLGWSRSTIPDFDHYILYENTSQDTSTAGEISFYYDQAALTHNINKNNVDTLAVYYYWVKVFDLGGRSSQFSAPDSVFR